MLKKKVVIPAVCVLAAGALIWTNLSSQGAAAGVLVSTTTLETMQLQNTVSLTGTVESEDGRKVYSTLNYPVEQVNVEVGDQVQAGDVLCLLKSDDLQLDLAQQQASYATAQQQADLQIEMSQKAYENAKNNYEENLDSSVLQADAAVRDARAAVSDARENFRIAESQLEGNVDDARDALREAEAALAQAEKDYKEATADIPGRVAEVEAQYAKIEKDFQEAQELHYYDKKEADQHISDAQNEWQAKHNSNEITTPLEEYKPYRDAQKEKKELLEGFAQTQANYQAAMAQKEAAVSAIQSQASGASSAVASAQGMVSSAESAYNSATDAYHGSSLNQQAQAIDSADRSARNAADQKAAVHNATEQQLETLQDNIRSSELAAQANQAQSYAIQKLQNTIDDTIVTAPVSGTVTAVYAQVGEPGNGLLFVIEDTQTLQVSTLVKEYDIGSIKEGMPVIIKTDATGEEAIAGQVSSIDPVAAKDANGDIKTGSDVEFCTTVQVLDENSGLRIGTTARMNVVLEQKDGVLAVPAEAIYTRPDGTTCLLVPETAEKGMIAKAIPVTVGLATDFYVEVSGGGLSQGMTVISNAEGITEGMAIQLDPTALPAEDALVPGASEE